ncbi:MAG: SIS domain-containing protein [Candidatus Gastranaerophilales bacterium]|nr:SIS domain-containing protein [Candidatus Gastranaerophilales bacterium]
MNIQELFNKRIENFKKLNELSSNVELMAKLIKEAFENKNKILLCGNGGSASDCNHIAAEFISRFQKERKSLPAISLCANNSIITAIANDYSFDEVFSRQIEGLGNKNDILIAISTSGKSRNVIKALETAKKQSLKTILLTGQNKTNLNVDLEINAPSNITCEIQEMHIALAHVICEMVEK